jgi:hypothetical protein
VVNVGYKEWEALPDDVSTRAAALLQLLSAAVGPLDSWQCVGAPTRSPGSLVATAEAAQAAAAAEQRQQFLHQQRDMMVNAWRAAGGASSSVASNGSNMTMFGSATPGTGYGVIDQQGSWAGPVNTTELATEYSPWGMPSADAGLGVATMPGGLGMWGSGAFSGGTPGGVEPGLLLQLRQLQQQLQQQQAWDAFMAADAARTSEDGGEPLLAAGDRMMSLESGAAASSVADGVGSVPPSPASEAQEGHAAAAAAAPGAMPAAEDLAVALAAAQQRWSNSPGSTQGSGGNCTSSSNKKPAAFMWGDPTSASIWAP